LNTILHRCGDTVEEKDFEICQTCKDLLDKIFEMRFDEIMKMYLELERQYKLESKQKKNLNNMIGGGI